MTTLTYDDYCKATGRYPNADNGARELWDAATLAEREACESVCDGVANSLRLPAAYGATECLRKIKERTMTND